MSRRKIGKQNKNSEWREKREDEEEKRRIRDKIVNGVGDAYKFVERRELTVRHVDDLPMLSGGLYAAQLLKISRRVDPEPDGLEEESKPNGVLKLPSDGSIFHDGIPFHHFSLTGLKPEHIQRLKKNGIELNQKAFSHAEDQQIRENWLSFAEAHRMLEDEAAKMVSAATATETQAEHRERIRFIRSSLFRPWMCSRLLDRTAGQVFRRCYHLYHVSSLHSQTEARIWTSDEDDQLLKLYKLHGPKWEFIGNELLRARYDCRRRHEKLLGKKGGEQNREEGQGKEGRGEEIDNEGKEGERERQRARKGEGMATNGSAKKNGIDEEEAELAGTSNAVTEEDDEQWSRVEVARLYEYLCDHLPRMPVLVALVSRYKNMDNQVNWADPKMRLSGRNAQERREKWEQLKESFRSAREECDQNVRVKEILRSILPEDTRILARARVEVGFKKRKPLSPSDHAKWVDKVREFCEKYAVEQPKDIDKTKLEKWLKSSDVMFHHLFRAIWRKFRMILFVGRTVGLFRMLPIDEDNLTVHLRLLVFILQHIQRMNVRKRTLRKYTRRFLRICGWTRRERIVLVDKAIHDDTSNEQLEQMQMEERQKKVAFIG